MSTNIAAQIEIALKEADPPVPVTWVKNVDDTFENLVIYHPPGTSEEDQQRARTIAAEVMAAP